MNPTVIFILAVTLSTPALVAIPRPVHTVVPTRQPNLRPHVPQAPPSMRHVTIVELGNGCTARTLAGDASGQTVKTCD